MRVLKILGLVILGLGVIGGGVFGYSYVTASRQPQQTQRAQDARQVKQVKQVKRVKQSNQAQTITNAQSKGGEEPSTSVQDKSQIATNAPKQSMVSGNAGDESKITGELDKIKNLQEIQRQKDFMLIIAQDDLEHYTWGEKSAFPSVWRQAYLEYNLNGNRVMLALRYDLDTYLACGDSDYALVWAHAKLVYDLYKDGKLKATMTKPAYQNFISTLNAVNQRLGVIYAKREYAPN